MAALDVLPLAAAKEHINFRPPQDQGQNDAEILEMIPAAVERVERHLGRTLSDAVTASFSERLAVKVVFATYWQTQRGTTTRGSRGGGASGTAIEADSGPAGAAPLTSRLTELLGDAAQEAGDAPRGSFPEPEPWPDPVRVGTTAWWRP